MVVVRSSRVAPLGWWRARAMARSAGLPMQHYQMTAVSLGGVQYQIKRVDSSPGCLMVWWLDGNHRLRLMIQKALTPHRLTPHRVCGAPWWG